MYLLLAGSIYLGGSFRFLGEALYGAIEGARTMRAFAHVLLLERFSRHHDRFVRLLFGRGEEEGRRWKGDVDVDHGNSG